MTQYLKHMAPFVIGAAIPAPFYFTGLINITKEFLEVRNDIQRYENQIGSNANSGINVVNKLDAITTPKKEIKDVFSETPYSSDLKNKISNEIERKCEEMIQHSATYGRSFAECNLFEYNAERYRNNKFIVRKYTESNYDKDHPFDAKSHSVSWHSSQ